jgi:mono/diheme cytochrome c family protein
MSKRLAHRFVTALAFAALLQSPSSSFSEPASSPQSAWSDFTLKSDKDLKDPLVRRGKMVFDARCRACHSAYEKKSSQTTSIYALPPMAGTAALEIKYKGEKPALLEERTDLTPEVVAFFVRKGSGVMPPFRPTEVSDDDLKALGAYLSRQQR